MFKDKIKKLDVLDMALVKLSVAAFVLFLLTVPNPTNNFFMSWIHTVHWGWFLAAAVILALRPQARIWGR
jgi:hypothetical protein